MLALTTLVALLAIASSSVIGRDADRLVCTIVYRREMMLQFSNNVKKKIALAVDKLDEQLQLCYHLCGYSLGQTDRLTDRQTDRQTDDRHIFRHSTGVLVH